MKLKIHSKVKHDLRDAIKYYENAQAGLGARFLEAFDEALENVVKQPLRWRLFYLSARRANLGKFPYLLIYEADEGEVLIYAIVHNKRHPSYWRKRLKSMPT